MSVTNITDGRRPPLGRRFEKGNPGKQPGAKPISERRARKLLAQAVIADVGGEHVADFHGDALQYMQDVYQGKRVGDPLRLSAAAQALKYERPALSAVVTKDISTTPVTSGGIESAIMDLLERGAANVVTIGSRPDTDSAGWSLDAGETGASEAPATTRTD
jgi:hypothetical protein